MDEMVTKPVTEAALSPSLPGPRRQRRFKKRHPLRTAAEVRLIRLLGGSMERADWATCRYTGAWLGLWFWHAVRLRQEVAIANVQLAFPTLSRAACRQIARRAMQNFAMSLCEFLHLRSATPQEIREYTEMEHREYLQDGLQQGRGVLLTTAHIGNWEIMAARAAQEFPVAVVARPRSNSGVEQHIEASRRAGGVEVISKFDSAREPLKALRANKTLGILSDQHGGDYGVVLPFFGRPSPCLDGPARLALLSGAPLVPAYGVRRTPWLADGRIVATAFPGCSLRRAVFASRDEAVLEGTRFIMASVEAIIRCHPDQWLWMHKRWRQDDGATQVVAGR